jgi:hypothetical protein
MANLTYATATITNGNTADATFVQGKFDDIKTYLENPGASAGIGTDNYHTNHADMCISFIISGAINVGGTDDFRMSLPAGISAGFAPTLLTFSQDNGSMDVSTTKTVEVTVRLSSGTFGSESTTVSLTGEYTSSVPGGTVFSTTAFGSNIIASGATILFAVSADIKGSGGVQGSSTVISLWGQALHRAKE